MAILFRLRTRFLSDRGATSAEYALMAGLITLVIAAAVTTFGVALSGIFDDAGTFFQSRNTP